MKKNFYYLSMVCMLIFVCFSSLHGYANSSFSEKDDATQEGVFITQQADKKTIKGSVTDKKGEPLPGVNVVVKGTTIGVTTDFDGNYSFDVPEDAEILVFSFIGYRTNEVLIGGKIRVDIIMVEDLLSLDEVVVTGGINPKQKIESSVAISTFNAKEIALEAPQSAATLLKMVPGFVVETSGGAVGNNLFARGIPSAGAYEYVQIQEDGIPVFEDGALQFANADNWYRVDETLNRMEAVRGGSGSIFATNSPGGIINLISKTGTNEDKGVAKFSVGDFGLLRTDLNLSGPLVKDKLFYNVGGFYRVDEGIRDPGFTANKGGQIKANLTYKLDNGYVRLNYKKLNDRNIFYLPIPLQGKDNPKGVKGFDPNFGTLTSRNFSKLNVPQPGGGSYQRDLEDGIHPIVDAIGAEMKFDINENWSIKNVFRNTDIDLTYNAIFTYGAPTAGAEAANSLFEVSNPIYEYAGTGEIANPELVAEVGFWAIDKQMHNFVNDFRFAYREDNFNLTFGYYYSNYKSNQQWNWSNLLIEATDDPRLLNLYDGDKSSGETNYARTLNGVSKISWLTRDAQTKGIINAFYLNSEIEASDDLNFDIGIRYDIDRYSGYKAFSDWDNPISLGMDETSADDFILVTGGPYTYWEYDVDKFSFSLGGNYKFTPKMSAYARISSGFRSPIEEAYYDNASDLSELKDTKVRQYELGYKANYENLALYASFFYMDMENIAFTDILADGTSEGVFAGSENIGLELEAMYKYDWLDLSFKGTIQDPKLTDLGATSIIEGNQVRRIPKFYFNFRPSAEITKDFSLFANWGHYGKKYVDNENKVELPSYDGIDFGANYTIDEITFSANLKNAFNEIGLTEGNPRVTSGSVGDTYYARPILGRNFMFSVTYNF